ncbi:MAG: hypothetical protein J07HQW2_00885 [Haloquadratum walsbyi J07HQW2]|uniref:Uncharacterized protein n=1 Tax=Haloquadratum walsbyi J07HQW2 TaxID=1238425 RepID=U1PQ61_9EURY|nr:MAG: hypothetical protein J07HQW2_00885 [Haloquadratum walsbyi J07HQW2]
MYHRLPPIILLMISENQLSRTQHKQDTFQPDRLFFISSVQSFILIEAFTSLLSKVTSFDLPLKQVCWFISVTKFVI